MEILILCGIYLAELGCYRLGLRILFDVKEKTKVWMAAGILLPFFVVELPVYKSGSNVLITLGVMTVLFLSIEGKAVDKGIQLVFVLVLVSFFENFIMYVLHGMLENTIIFEKYTKESCLCQNMFSLICLFGIYKLKIKSSLNRNINIGSYIYFIIGIIASAMMLCVSLLSYVKDYIDNPRYILLCNIFDIVIHISIVLLLVSIVYIKNTHERMTELLKTEKILKETQVSHYKHLLQQEENTRKYRHDMKNHLLYMQTLLQKNRIADAQFYLEQMQGNFAQIQGKNYATGNMMLDAIVNYFLGMLPENTKILITGRTPVEFAMEEIDVCTVFSNLFQNIVEEILENELENPKVEISIHKGRDYVEYEIKNTTLTAGEFYEVKGEKLPSTTKADKTNHGIGLENVKTTVERNGGRLYCSHRQYVFAVKVILPLKSAA